MSDDREALATVTRAVTKPRGGRSEPARLRAVHPTALAWSTPLGRRSVVIGRVAAADVATPLHHETVSRRHLEVRWDERRGCHLAIDLGSHNGTRIDGEDAGELDHRLDDGTVVQVGDVCLVYERGEPGDDVGLAVDGILGRSPAVGRLRAAIERAAADPSPALLVGDTGTGKEWVARELHRMSGRPGPLVAVNCSALSPQIVDSQLFGHIKGAFTGAATDHPGLFRAAEGGTLFLDEIGEMPLELQPKLLRALQEGEVTPVGSTRPTRVDVRVVAATNRRLQEEIESGRFRRDLYARLALWEIAVPTLAERRADILAWLDRLFAAWKERRPEHAGSAELTLSAAAAEEVLLYAWPQGLRELDRLVHELATAGGGAPIQHDALPAWLRVPTPRDAPPPGDSADRPSAADPGEPTRPPVPDREVFVAVFQRLDGNVRAIAKHFARDRRQIYRWIEAHGLADRRGPRD